MVRYGPGPAISALGVRVQRVGLLQNSHCYQCKIGRGTFARTINAPIIREAFPISIKIIPLTREPRRYNLQHTLIYLIECFINVPKHKIYC